MKSNPPSCEFLFQFTQTGPITTNSTFFSGIDKFVSDSLFAGQYRFILFTFLLTSSI